MSMRQRVQDIARLGDRSFARRYPVMSLWQTQAENFHVMRADFTRRRYFSEEFGSYLMSGMPARCHRDLTNSFSSMLRRDQWFHAQTDSEQVNEDRDAKIWLDWASKTMRRAMYDRRAGFVRAAKIADGDFCAFGNAVITREIVDYSHFLYRTWHLRDVAWEQGVNGDIQAGSVHFNWKPQADQLVAKFKDSKTGTIAPEVLAAAEKRDGEQLSEIQCRRFLIPADQYDLPLQQTRGRPFVSVYLDLENETILEEVALKTWPVTIPRWEFGGSMWGDQYGYSPAVVYGLPDGRMHQQIMLSMLTASEMATYPAMIAVGEAINGAVNLYASGITQVDADYDERTGEVLRPITTDFRGIEYAAKQLEMIKAGLEELVLPLEDPLSADHQGDDRDRGQPAVGAVHPRVAAFVRAGAGRVQFAFVRRHLRGLDEHGRVRAARSGRRAFVDAEDPQGPRSVVAVRHPDHHRC